MDTDETTRLRALLDGMRERAAQACIDEEVRAHDDRAGVVVAAWGANKLAHEHARGVLSLVPPGLEITCLGKTQGGFPRHPLYMRGDTPLSTFSMGSP